MKPRKERTGLVFVLGAGISRDVLPLSGHITETVLTGKADHPRTVGRDSVGIYDLMMPDDPRRGLDEWSPRVIEFLKWLHDWMPEDQRDYEALYYACQQVYDEVTGEFVNPILWPFIDLCIKELPNLWGHDSTEGLPPGLHPVSKVNFLMAEATSYIAGMVAAALRPASGAMGKLRWAHGPLLDACADTSTTRFVDIVTLNHDTLLETSLAAERFRAVEDGFQPSRRFSGLAEWKGYAPKGRPRIRLVKLHGSVDWWDAYLRRNPRRRILVRASESPSRLEDRRGRQWDSVRRSSILVGTSNKMLDYLRPDTLTRLAVFRRALLNSNAVVVSGYSFRDKGVNNLLIAWAKRGRRLVVVNRSLTGENPPETANHAIARAWPVWIREGILSPVAKPFAEASWPELLGCLSVH